MSEPRETARLTVAERRKVYEYLDSLRESGVTNMWGAGLYVERKFKWSSKKASDALGDWMITFSDRHPQ